jgi:hypothetical protein
VDAGDALLPYTLTGAPTEEADDRVTNRRTVVFTSKLPNLGQGPGSPARWPFVLAHGKR